MELSDAESELASARSELRDAQSEFSDARHELSEARHDLSECKRCLAIAQDACKLARFADSFADDAVRSAAECAEAVEAAQSPLTDLLAQQAAMESNVDTLHTAVAKSHAGNREAHASLRFADQHAQVAEDTAHVVSNELSLRMDHLIEFNKDRRLPPGLQ
jgi:phage shock protein A